LADALLLSYSPNSLGKYLGNGFSFWMITVSKSAQTKNFLGQVLVRDISVPFRDLVLFDT
jgi:hypothetical protein